MPALTVACSWLHAEDCARAAAPSTGLRSLPVMNHTADLWLQAEDFAGAAALAFELRQPGRLLSVVNKAQEKGPAACQKILAQLVAGFDVDSLRMSLEYAREWNTNARHCHAAQALLQATLLQHPPEVCLGRFLVVERVSPGVGRNCQALPAPHWWWAAVGTVIKSALICCACRTYGCVQKPLWCWLRTCHTRWGTGPGPDCLLMLSCCCRCCWGGLTHWTPC